MLGNCAKVSPEKTQEKLGAGPVGGILLKVGKVGEQGLVKTWCE